MTSKKFVIGTVLSTLSILLIFAGIIIYIDPFYQYHKPLSNFSYRPAMNLHSYINPGIAKNFDYDTVILGSSLVRTFQPSYILEKHNLNSIKLPVPEARGKDINDIFELVEKDNLSTVIMGLDVFAYTVPFNMTSNEKPLYLYDTDYLNDTRYVLNKTVMFKEVVNIIKNTRQGLPMYTQDDYQNWENELSMEKNAVIDWWKNREGVEDFLNVDYDTNMIDYNINTNLIPMIKENEDVTFKIFIPPYSIFYYGDLLDKNSLQSELTYTKYIISKIIGYPNVEIYFTPDVKEMILNYNHYLDYLHYDSIMANGIIDYIFDNTNRLNKENYESIIENFYLYILSFNFDEFVEKSEHN